VKGKFSDLYKNDKKKINNQQKKQVGHVTKQYQVPHQFLAFSAATHQLFPSTEKTPMERSPT